MSSGIEELSKEVQILKNQVEKLQKDLEFLWENYQAMGYLPNDVNASAEEQHDLETIDRLVENDNLDGFEELS